MRDPREGLTPEGFITTGASRERVPGAFEPVLAAAVGAVGRRPGVELHLYGSVATGTAEVGRSDVDLLTVGLPDAAARRLAEELSARFAGLCREVAVGAAQPADLEGGGAAAYGNRVFLRHYTVCLAGADAFRPAALFRGDAAAARGFNGDLAVRLADWRREPPTSELGRAVARKTLLALAGLVSVREGTWTTDRAGAASRAGQLWPAWEPGLARLLAWSEGAPAPPAQVAQAIAVDGVVDRVVAQFATRVGLWS